MGDIIAIILARGGSKGIPKKNLRNFCGKPLLQWSIEQTKKIKEISSIWVSSENDEILNFSKKLGVNIIKRPESLADDNSTSESGWLHALSYIEKNYSLPKIVLVLQPTSPLRESLDLQNGLDSFRNFEYDSLFSGSILGDTLIWSKNPSNLLKSLNYDYQNRSIRQEFPEQFIENGSFYIFKPEILRKHNNRFGGKIGIQMMDFWKSFELDTLDDWDFCETLMKHYLLKKNTK